MSGVGLDWYKREPAAYLMDVQGLSSKEHAVYSIIIDLLYSRGGTIPNDPKFIAGFISDMGTASIRNTLASLDANPRISITITKTEISQKRAKNEVKTKQKQSENARETGKKGGVLSAELRAGVKENNDLAQGYPSNEIQPEKRREEKSKDSITTVSCPNDVSASPSGDVKKEFEKIWQAYPRKVQKKPALKAYTKARKNYAYNHIAKPLREFIDATNREGEPESMIHLATWLNQERFDPDEDQQAAVTGRPNKGRNNGRQQDTGSINDWSDKAAGADLTPPPDGT